MLPYEKANTNFDPSPLCTDIGNITVWRCVQFYAPLRRWDKCGPFRELYSYFDLTPFGYANFAPMITAVLTCVLVLLIVIYCFTGRPGLFNTIRTFVWICTVISLGPLVLGIRFYSVVGGLITMAFIAELFLLYSTLKNQSTASCE